eukprot:CAMPEP_0174319778 /NCGR_PEP_ID=MMETSP0810-20121108/9107_1 /TAXON_ID=73025 ORGANISM="Eutreptiella gymnastica-like, Strain CCMP1594" /NCGR_SAMPLE_ID=MMETSP0810 /ASSEMBLY_ACC=CAM_ASM_000659 /LENGTH=100 /DNA_ID=CAMNT_0015430465 /DNA_START=258 /DNA_END=560 /DNA_ORIENTATION=-
MPKGLEAQEGRGHRWHGLHRLRDDLRRHRRAGQAPPASPSRNGGRTAGETAPMQMQPPTTAAHWRARACEGPRAPSGAERGLKAQGEVVTHPPNLPPKVC